MLFGKPLLTKFNAMHEYARDIIKILQTTLPKPKQQPCLTIKNQHPHWVNIVAHTSAELTLGSKHLSDGPDPQSKPSEPIWTLNERLGHDPPSPGAPLPEINVKFKPTLFTWKTNPITQPKC